MKYKQEYNGDWIRPLSERHRISCCDCGLVHDIEFRVKDKRVEFRAWRNNRATAQKRRGKKFK